MNTELDLKRQEIIALVTGRDEESGTLLNKLLTTHKDLTLRKLGTLEVLLKDNDYDDELVVLALEMYQDIEDLKFRLGNSFCGSYTDLKEWAYELFCHMYDEDENIPRSYIDLDFFLKELRYDNVILEGKETYYIFRG